MWRVGALVIVALSSCVAVAVAAERTGQAGVAVESAAPGGATLKLIAQDTATGGLCLDVTVGNQNVIDTVCPRPSTTPRDDIQPRLVRLGDNTIVYGAVSRRTAVLELIFSNGRRVRLKTAKPTEYAGAWAGRARFYAVSVFGAVSVASATARSSTGKALAAVDHNPLALPPVNGRATLLKLDDESGNPAEFVAVDTRVLAPTKRTPARRKRSLCVGLRSADPTKSPPPQGRAVCASRTKRVEIRFAANCDTGRLILYGFGPSLIRTADVFMAGGDSRRMKRVGIPSRLGHRSAGLVLELAGGTPESVVAYDRFGGRRARVSLDGGVC